jgi:alpha-glucosidase
MTTPPGPWWRDAVFYQVYVRSFTDSDGDGLGDLPGVTSRLPYLRDLGVDALWLTPFYPSPQRDAGYDVSDYLDVDPRFGSLSDADDLFTTAHRLGLKVIVDLVPNHTSDAHAWFQAALAAGPGSPERARYLFRPGKGRGGAKPPNNWVSVFGGPAWTRVPDPSTGSGQRAEWYLHLFDSSQPDLNWRNPDVPAMFEGVLRFWLDRGVDGFRIDVAHSLFKVASLRDQRQALAPDGDRMSVAEAWTAAPESLARYVRPDELSQAFNFAWLLAPWSASAFADVITSTRSALAPVAATATWVLSNHDVTRHATRYGGGPVGLARARAATLTMLALPGSSYLYQGEELGLEEADVPPELRQDPAWFRTGNPGRDGSRVPLPWRGTRPPYGFSPAGTKTWLPMPDDWAALTVAAQRKDPTSTWSFYRDALRARRRYGDAGDDVEVVRDRSTVLELRRGPLAVVCNCGRRPVRLPAGEVVIASGPVADGLLPPDTAAWLAC